MCSPLRGVNTDLCPSFWAGRGAHFFLDLDLPDLDLPVRLFFDRELFFPAVLPSLATAGEAAFLPAK